MTIGPFGSNLKVSDYSETGVPLIFVRNIRRQDFGTDRRKYVSQSKAEELVSHTAQGGDILITKMGDPPGDACVYPDDAPQAVITSDCIKWTLAPMLLERRYFAYFINSVVGRSQFADITKGVAQQKVSLDRFRKIAIALPGLEEQAIITDRLEVEFQQLHALELLIASETSRIAQLRQKVLQSAFAGQLTSQEASDEPAANLLERIAVERTDSYSMKPEALVQKERKKKVKV